MCVCVGGGLMRGGGQQHNAGQTTRRRQTTRKQHTNTDTNRNNTRKRHKSTTEADVPLREDVADLKAGPAEDVASTRHRGDQGPIDVVPTGREEVEEQEVLATPEEQ